jgi:hypothetical protein
LFRRGVAPKPPSLSERCASGRATPALADALAQAEAQVKTLTSDVASMESAKGHAFTPPPRAWIVNRIQKLNELLSNERSSQRSHFAG